MQQVSRSRETTCRNLPSTLESKLQQVVQPADSAKAAVGDILSTGSRCQSCKGRHPCQPSNEHHLLCDVCERQGKKNDNKRSGSHVPTSIRDMPQANQLQALRSRQNKSETISRNVNC